MQAPKNGMFVGAASYAGPVSPKLRVPCPKGARHTIPRLSLDEATQQLKYYAVEVHIAKIVPCQGMLSW